MWERQSSRKGRKGEEGGDDGGGGGGERNSYPTYSHYMVGASGVLSSSGIDRAAGVSSGLRACDGGGYIGGGI